MAKTKPPKPVPTIKGTIFIGVPHFADGVIDGPNGMTSDCDTRPGLERWPVGRTVIFPVTISIPPGRDVQETATPTVETDTPPFAGYGVLDFVISKVSVTVQVQLPWPTGGPTTWPPTLKLTIKLPTVAGVGGAKRRTKGVD